MSKKKQTIVLSVIGAAIILVLMVGVTFAYFTSTMRGEAANTNVSTKLIGGISFTAQAVDGSEILPGWTSGEKTVTVTAEASDVDMEYSCTLNITENGLTDLKLTLSGDNYVTENNNATLGTTAVTIARGTIPAREEVTSKTMTYTISLPETGENQTEGNSGKNFAATVSCKLDNEIKYYEGSNNVVATNFYDKLLADNPTRLTRTSFDTVLTDTNTGTLYTESGNWTEDGSTVYYFAGQAQNNWVKFGKTSEATCMYEGIDVAYNNINQQVAKESNLTEDECTDTYLCKFEIFVSGNIYQTIYFSGLAESECNVQSLGISQEQIEQDREYGIEYVMTYLNEKATYDSGVKDLYWRIIRTNEDGGVRLLYVGLATDTKKGNIGRSPFNTNNDETFHDSHIGYMYGTDGNLENHRTNANNSTIKTFVDSWYNTSINSLTDGTYKYNDYLSKTAIYCNDRSTDAWYIGEGDEARVTIIGAYGRLREFRPSYKCGVSKTGELYTYADVADKFSVSEAGGGNGDLTYPIALITADEIAYAGGIVEDTVSDTLYSWYSQNSLGETLDKNTWTMSPRSISENSGTVSFFGTTYNPILDGGVNQISETAVRPVVSLKSCALTTGGNGSSTTPYEITIDAECAAAEN